MHAEEEEPLPQTPPARTLDEVEARCAEEGFTKIFLSNQAHVLKENCIPIDSEDQLKVRRLQLHWWC